MTISNAQRELLRMVYQRTEVEHKPFFTAEVPNWANARALRKMQYITIYRNQEFTDSAERIMLTRMGKELYIGMVVDGITPVLHQRVSPTRESLLAPQADVIGQLRTVIAAETFDANQLALRKYLAPEDWREIDKRRAFVAGLEYALSLLEGKEPTPYAALYDLHSPAQLDDQIPTHSDLPHDGRPWRARRRPSRVLRPQ